MQRVFELNKPIFIKMGRFLNENVYSALILEIDN